MLFMSEQRIKFEHEEDRIFFCKLLCTEGEEIEHYAELFDFRDADYKRKEFNNNRNLILKRLVNIYGRRCLLGYTDKCDINSGIAVDHLIPLSSNKLNKQLRKLDHEPGKKVKAQSIGSNNFYNLILACNKCNGHKHDGFLNPEKIRSILKEIRYLHK